MIPYGRQDIQQADIDAVVDVLRSDFLTQGPVLPRFEKAIADYVGANFGVGVNSATSALHIACLALGLVKGDWLWTTPITFVASANCALYCGAKVDFVDIDPRTYNLDPMQLEAKLKVAEREDRLPKIVVPVALCGQSCDMLAIKALSDRYGFKIIEDASHAIGARYGDTAVGHGGLSDITIFSFHPVKIITTAEGGLAVTNDSKLAELLRLFRSHGVTRDPVFMTTESDGPWYYQQIELGYNYRMTEIQAALGMTQFDRLDQYVTQRNFLADRYDRELAKLPLQLPYQSPSSYSARHLYVVLLKEDYGDKKHLDVFEELRAAGIGVNLHYIPVHCQPFYKDRGFKEGMFPIAENYYSRAISLPLFATMTEVQQDTVISSLHEILLP